MPNDSGKTINLRARYNYMLFWILPRINYYKKILKTKVAHVNKAQSGKYLLECPLDHIFDPKVHRRIHEQ